MMRNTIERKMVETTIQGYSVNVQPDGKPIVKELPPVIVYGKIGIGEATKELRRTYPKAENITVGKITSVERRYRISVDDFIKHAKVVADKTN